MGNQNKVIITFWPSISSSFEVIFSFVPPSTQFSNYCWTASRCISPNLIRWYIGQNNNTIGRVFLGDPLTKVPEKASLLFCGGCLTVVVQEYSSSCCITFKCARVLDNIRRTSSSSFSSFFHSSSGPLPVCFWWWTLDNKMKINVDNMSRLLYWNYTQTKIEQQLEEADEEWSVSNNLI